MIIAPAASADAPAVVALVNAAYRGDAARRGWAHEADLLDGQRADLAMVRDLLGGPGALLLLREAPGAPLAGCVAVMPDKAPQTWTIGMLTVETARQGAGLGRRLIEAAEAHAARHGAETVEMTVIAARETLIAYYERRGYRRTGGRKPFPYGDERFGRPLRDDLSFVVIEKTLPRPAER